MAVWCTGLTASSSSELEAHFNYWRISGDEDFRRVRKAAAKDFLEIGVMVSDPSQVGHVCLYIPQSIKGESITDCGGYFSKPEIAQGIFNELLSTAQVAGPGNRCIELRKGADLFCRVHRFMPKDNGIDSSELTIADFAGGTLLTITRQALNETSLQQTNPIRTYFRIRVLIETDGVPAFIRTVPTPDRFLQSGFDEIEYIDFRLNEARTLPPQVETRMRDEGANLHMKLTLVAFLTAVPVRSGLSVSNTQFHKLRLLEHGLWSGYVPGGIPDGMMVYHWKRHSVTGIGDFSAFVKLQTRRTGRKTLLTYLGVAFVFGIAGNLAASALENWWSSPAVSTPASSTPSDSARIGGTK